MSCCCVKLLFLLVAIILGCTYYSQIRKNTFNDNILKQAATIPQSHSCPKMSQYLRGRFPNEIMSADDMKWLGYAAKGFSGFLCPVHTSMFETVSLLHFPFDQTSYAGGSILRLSYVVLRGKVVVNNGERNTTFLPGDLVTNFEGNLIHVSADTYVLGSGKGLSLLGFWDIAWGTYLPYMDVVGFATMLVGVVRQVVFTYFQYVLPSFL